MKILGVIPARFASTRFPGKPLVMINGKSMIQRVYEQAKKCKSLARIVVATDDERIFKHVQSFGGEAMMTADTHQSGTDRCAEVVGRLNFEIQTAFLDSDTAPIIGKITPRFELFEGLFQIGFLLFVNLFGTQIRVFQVVAAFPQSQGIALKS